MFSPPSSYDDLLKLMTRQAQQDKIDDQIVEILKRFFEKELDQANHRLSRPERVRLLREVAQTILTDVLGQLDGQNREQ